MLVHPRNPGSSNISLFSELSLLPSGLEPYEACREVGIPVGDDARRERKRRWIAELESAAAHWCVLRPPPLLPVIPTDMRQEFLTLYDHAQSSSISL